MRDILVDVGHPLYQRLSNLISFGVFLLRFSKAALRNWGRGMNVLFQGIAFQIYFTCIQALPVILFLSLFVVAVFISQSDNFVADTTAAEYFAKLFVIVIIRELAPLLTALVVIGRSGTAIASELASMAANEEIDALKVMGVDPLYYLGVPRVVGLTVSVVCLSITFSLMGMFFTMLICFYEEGVAPVFFLEGVTSFISVVDLLLNLIKSFLFGLGIALVCSFWGFSTTGSATEIPQATTKAVISSVILCFVLSALITVIVY